MRLRQSICGICTAWALLFGSRVDGAMLVVNAGGDLQAALTAAQPGDTILVQAGAVFTGSYRLPAKNGTTDITIRSTAVDGSLPPAGARMTPAYAASLPKFRPASGPAFRTAAGASYWRLQFLEILPSTATGTADLVQFGSGGTSQNTMSAVPHHLVLDRCYLHGDASFGQRRGVSLNSRDSRVMNSYFADFKSTTVEAQAIAGWNGPGPFLIENNYLEAAGENVMFGGADPQIPNLIPSGITLRRNLIAKPSAWVAQGWVVKNLIELKNAADVTIEGNTIEGSWLADQKGHAILLTPRNQNNTAPWSQVRNILIRSNVIRHVAAGINVTGYDNLASAQQTQAITITNNLFYDVSRNWTARAAAAIGRVIFIGAGPKDIAVTHNTMISTGSGVFFDGGASPTGVQIRGFVFNDNIVDAKESPVYGSAQGEGTRGLTYYCPLYQFLGNVIGRYSNAAYPTGTDLVPYATLEEQFVDFAHDDYRLAPTAIIAATSGVDFAALNEALTGTSSPPSPIPPPSPVPPPAPPPTGSRPYGGTAATIPGTVQLENYDAGGSGVAYRDTTSGNSGGAYRSNNVDIEVTTDTGGGYDLRSVKATEWLQYTVNAVTAGTYTLDVRVASAGAGGTFHVEVNGIDKTGPLLVPDTGGWQTWVTLSKSGVSLAGQQTLRLVMDTNGPSGAIGNMNWLRVR